MSQGNVVEKLIGGIMAITPLIFALGFLTPVMMQGIDAIGWAPPFGLSPLIFSLIICGSWGMIAQVFKRWI